jgi:hypothetical protein
MGRAGSTSLLLFHDARYRHNSLTPSKFQDIESFLIPCPGHVPSRLPVIGDTCKYVTGLLPKEA